MTTPNTKDLAFAALRKLLDEGAPAAARPADNFSASDPGVNPGATDVQAVGTTGMQDPKPLGGRRPADKNPVIDPAQAEATVNPTVVPGTTGGEEEDWKELEAMGVEHPLADETEPTDEPAISEDVLEKFVDGEDTIVEDIEAADKKLRDSVKKSINEQFSALVESTSEIPAEFKQKVKTLFEGVVDERLNSLKTQLVEACKGSMAKNKKSVAKKMMEEVDKYLSYVSEEWMKENKIAVESGLRQLIAESFMGDLKGLFEKYHIAIPDQEISLVEKAIEKIEGLEKKLNEKTDEIKKLNEKVTSVAKAEAFAEATKGLTSTQVEKVKTLTEGFEFNDEFKKKISTIVESVKTVKAPSANLITEDGGKPVVEPDEKKAPEQLHSDVSAVVNVMRSWTDRALAQ